MRTGSTDVNRRVLHIINGEHYAGAEKVQDLLAARLPSHGYDVGFACVRPGVFDAERRTKSAPLFNAPMANRLDFRPATALIRLVRRDRYCLIHAHTPRSALLGLVVARVTGLPLVIHLHGPTVRAAARPWINRANLLLERRLLPRAAMVIVVSRSIGAYATHAGTRPERVVCIPNGVATPGSLSERSRPTGPWMLGIVALFRPGKGLETLLEAIERITAMGYDIHLRAVGSFESPGYETAILRRANQLGLSNRIEWRGFRKDIDSELKAMDLLVLPSLSEGIPMAILEAMAVGVPVVSTHIDGVTEVVRDGTDGLLAEPGDVESLVDRLHQFLDGKVDWQGIRTAAYDRQVTAFSDVAMARATAKVYDNLLATRHHG